MSEVFNAYEIFEIAEQIERNGGKFYRRAAEVAKSQDAKDFLLDLAKMEDEHESFFSSLKNKFSLEGDETFPDIDNQTLGYIRAMAENKVFGNIEEPTEKIKPDSSVEELINTAIDFEKNTIVYFSTVKDAVPENLGKDKIDSLIREEIGHITILMKKLHEVKGD